MEKTTRRVSRTSSVGRMLAHLPDELRDGIPVSLASGIVKLVEVAPGFGWIRGRLLMGRTGRSVSRRGEETGERVGGLRPLYSRCDDDRRGKKGDRDYESDGMDVLKTQRGLYTSDGVIEEVEEDGMN